MSRDFHNCNVYFLLSRIHSFLSSKGARIVLHILTTETSRDLVFRLTGKFKNGHLNFVVARQVHVQIGFKLEKRAG